MHWMGTVGMVQVPLVPPVKLQMPDKHMMLVVHGAPAPPLALHVRGVIGSQ